MLSRHCLIFAVLACLQRELTRFFATIRKLPAREGTVVGLRGVREVARDHCRVARSSKASRHRFLSRIECFETPLSPGSGANLGILYLIVGWAWVIQYSEVDFGSGSLQGSAVLCIDCQFFIRPVVLG